jgi:glucokinase
MAEVYLAIDLGGTRIRAARCRADGSIEQRTEVFTPAGEGAEAVIAHLEDSVRSVWPDHDSVKAIGVGAPGPIDPWTGLIFTAVNLQGFDNLPLRDRLMQTFKVPVYVGNDANVAAMAEWRFGAGRGHHDLVYLTVSTGIGGGVICADRLLLGSRGLATELGHVTTDVNSGQCKCGNIGCIEHLAAGPNIVRQAIERLEAGEQSELISLVDGDFSQITMELVAEAAANGDALANAVLDRAFHALGLNIVSLLHVFNPSIVIIGGGVSNLDDRLFEPLRSIVAQHVMNPLYVCPIVPAQLSADVGLLGALALTLDPPPQR